MGKKKSFLTVTDMFCGAGGSSQGVKRLATRKGGGLELSLAMNHWPLAIRTHAANFPDTDHDCADISASDPRRYNSTDILIASPECTNHSLAKGKTRVKKQLNIFEEQKAAEDRSRATMWDVPRFAEAHGYNIIITENVVDAKRWVLYDSWLQAMDALGYYHQECFFNSMHFHPVPQSRDRLYVVFWKKKNKRPQLDYSPPAFCGKCEKDVSAIKFWKPGCLPWGKYRTQYEYRCSCGTLVEPYYYAAFNCIDWSIKSERIGDKKRKLKPNTRRRIEIGIEKYWNSPFVIYGGDQSQANRVYSLGKSMPTQCAQPWHSLITPFVAHTSQNFGKTRSYKMNKPLATQTTTQDAGLVMPPEPFVIRNCNPGTWSKIGDPIGTQITTSQHSIISPPLPFIIDYYGKENYKSTEGELPTQPTQVKHGLIFPPFLSSSGHGGSVNDISKPLGTQTTHQNYDMVTMPFQIEFHRTGTARSLSEPISTQMAQGKHNAIITNEAIQAFIGYYYGNAYETHLTDPLGACTTKDRHYIVKMPAGKKIEVDDCYYRMIRAREVGKAMAFAADYIVYGDEREQVRQFGNAVTPPVMEWLIEQCVNSLS